jgi:putative transposase
VATKQVLTSSLRLPDAAQADALRLLDASRQVINQTILTLWPRLAEFADRPFLQAWKHVTDLMDSPASHGNRQWRCEAETAGRILRGQAERERLFALVRPLLADDVILPADAKHSARKDRRALIQQMRAAAHGESATTMELVNIAEQACNVYLRTGAFPATYDQLQTVPMLNTGILTYAADDGMAAGQTYRARIDREAGMLTYRLRGPNEEGIWEWRTEEILLPLPAPLLALLREGSMMAPTLREVAEPAGTRYVVLDVMVEVPAKPAPALEDQDRVLGWDWGVTNLLTAAVVTINGDQPGRPFFLDTGGFDGRQARLRRQIDQLQACRARVQQLHEQCPDSPHCPEWERQEAQYATAIACCWRKYKRRNKELAHLAANLLLFLAQIQGCALICGENLSSLRMLERGKGVRGRWRNWRRNTTIRAEIQRVLSYKTHRWGLRTREVTPKDTSHTCPRCGEPAQTYASSSLTTIQDAIPWGKWLICHNPLCGWNGARDYAAAMNIARLGVAFLAQYHATKTFRSFTMASIEVKPCRYTPQGAALRLPPQGLTPRPRVDKRKLAYSGWAASAWLRTSHPAALLLVLSSATIRKHVLLSA